MSRINQRPSAILLRGRFKLEDTINLTQQDIELLAELDAEVMLNPIPDAEKTAEERRYEQKLLAYLAARTPHP